MKENKTLLNKQTHIKFLSMETLIEANQFSQIDLQIWYKLILKLI